MENVDPVSVYTDPDPKYITPPFLELIQFLNVEDVVVTCPGDA
jgi:hypothetical protein